MTGNDLSACYEEWCRSHSLERERSLPHQSLSLVKLAVTSRPNGLRLPRHTKTAISVIVFMAHRCTPADEADATWRVSRFVVASTGTLSADHARRSHRRDFPIELGYSVQCSVNLRSNRWPISSRPLSVRH